MPIKHSSDQPGMTLEEFYTNLSVTSTNNYVDVGERMLCLVQQINEMFKETIIWGLTSHARLVLQNEDDWKANWYVIISNIGMKEYYFEYLMPENIQPWENAYVRGQANNIDEAKKYLLIAMGKSGGWADNEELRQLLHVNSIEI